MTAEKEKIKKREYRLNHPEIISAQGKRHYKKHKEEMKLKRKKLWLKQKEISSLPSIIKEQLIDKKYKVSL